MNPAGYPAVYWVMPVWLADGTVTNVTIKNYLQSGKGAQSARALAAKGVLTKAVKKLLGVSTLPATFEVWGYPIWSISIDRVFMGKGAPDEIQDTLWLASACGILDGGTIGTYCDNNLGMDCGGFVACLWGIGKPQNGHAVVGSTGFLPRSFWNFDRSLRRTKVGDIKVGDAIIFFKHMKGDDTDLASTDPTKGGEAYHIGAVGSIGIGSGQIELGTMESSGGAAVTGGNGVNYRVRSNLPIKTANGLVYGDAGDTRVYFVGKQGNMTSYLPYGVNYDAE